MGSGPSLSIQTLRYSALATQKPFSKQTVFSRSLSLRRFKLPRTPVSRRSVFREAESSAPRGYLIPVGFKRSVCPSDRSASSAPTRLVWAGPARRRSRRWRARRGQNVGVSQIGSLYNGFPFSSPTKSAVGRKFQSRIQIGQGGLAVVHLFQYLLGTAGRKEALLSYRGKPSGGGDG